MGDLIIIIIPRSFSPFLKLFEPLFYDRGNYFCHDREQVKGWLELESESAYWRALQVCEYLHPAQTAVVVWR